VQFSELQKLSDLDLGSRQVTSACTISVPDHVTVASSNTDIWPFEVRVLSTFGKV